MKQRFLAGLFVLLVAQFSASLNAQNTAQVYRIDLSGHGDFKDLFEAGLEPKRSGSGTFLCSVEEKTLNFDLGHGNSVTIPAQSCFFNVLMDESLSEINATSPPYSLEEARTWMLPICRTFGRPERELDEFLAKVRKGYKDFGWIGDDNEGFGVGMERPPRNSGLPAIGARLQSRARDVRHPVQIAVHVYWERPSRTLISHGSQLMPPKGYEHVSMEPVAEDPEWLRKGEEAPNLVKALNTPQQIQQMRDSYNAKHQHANSPPQPGQPTTPAAIIDTNLYVINLTGKGTLKDVFDSGLRPKRWDSSLVSECLVEDKLLRFVITNNYAVTVYADTCTFKVNANGSLRSIWAESPYLTAPQARRWMLPVVEKFGKSPQALDDHLKLVTTGDRNAEMQMRISEGSSSFGVGTPAPAPQSDLPFMGVELSWRWNRELPTQIIVRIEWERRFAEMRSPDLPPSPPPGYQQFPIVTDPPLAEARRTIGRLPAWLEPPSTAKVPAPR